MIFTVVGDANSELRIAEAVATALCAIGVTQPFTGGEPYRLVETGEALIELMCDSSEFLRAKAGFLANGFSVLGAASKALN
jgi:hypothetical protein